MKDNPDPNVEIVIGFTGSRHGMSEKQFTLLKAYMKAIWLQKNSVTVHHGDCIGTDTQVHHLAVEFDFNIVIHPPLNTRLRACNLNSGRPLVIMPPKPYLERNHDIVDACLELVALPFQKTELQRGSGTWATIRYARSVERENFIIFPDGSTRHEEGAR
jgi:hypothetical protein